MRIRKNAKISPLLYASSSLKPGALVQTHVCQLNQSPWDVITFSPPSSPHPPSQANGSGIRVANGSSECFASAAERGLSSRRRSEYSEAATLKTEEEDIAPPPLRSKGTIICRKTDGKIWREAAEGNSHCEHHLSLVKSYGVVHYGASIEPQRRTRPRKAPASSSSEFYYYSGFGPRWDKRRGERTRHYLSKNLGDAADVEVEAVSHIGDEDSDFAEYEDDDDDDDDEECKDNGKKRVRKPIKARSLKSLL